MRTLPGLILLVLVCAGCASGGPTVSAAQCAKPNVQVSEYLIGPGDTLQVVVWRDEGLSATVPVRPDGKVSTPMVEDMVAAGKSPSQLAADMEDVLGEYLRTPDVSVIVTSQGVANQIQVVGEVGAPRSLSYHAGIRVLDVLVGSGGIGQFAAGNRATIIRETADGQVRCEVRLNDLMDGDMTQNIYVFPGDVLVVPESRF